MICPYGIENCSICDFAGSDKEPEDSLSRSLASNDHTAGTAERFLFQTGHDLRARLGTLVGSPIDTRKRR